MTREELKIGDWVVFERNENEHYTMQVVSFPDDNMVGLDGGDIFVTARLDSNSIRPWTVKDPPKRRKKRIYISGPISGHDINERRAEFQRVSYEMVCRGYEPVNPMENGLPPEATTREHMKRDIELIMTCDYIYMMRRWTHSKGCKVEFDVATSIGLPVFFEESGELIEFE